MEQSVAEYVDEVWEDVVADIEQLVSYPSVAVAADAEPGAPFGRRSVTLDCALGIAQKLGYQTSDDGGYVGIADIPGRGDKQLATICHVDSSRWPRLEHRPVCDGAPRTGCSVAA